MFLNFTAFGIGILIECLLVLYFRAISNGLTWVVGLLAFVITILPFIIINEGIFKKKKLLIFLYALGTGIGAITGMII